METEPDFDGIDQAMNRLPQIIPDMLDTLIPEWELLIGKKAKKLPSSSEIDAMIEKGRRLADIIKKLEEIKGQELTPKAAAEVISLLNQMLRLVIPRIPRGTEPVSYVIEVVRQISDLPSTGGLPPELDYAKKHWSLRDFVCDLVQSTDETMLDDFLQEAVAGHHLIPQFQRLFNKISLPKELQKLPATTSLRSVEKLKLGLRGVTADWERWISLPYGLVMLKSGRVPTWDELRRARLWDKVSKVLAEPLLNPLAKLEWVTVRNALDHGSAFFEPSINIICFQDISREVRWQVHEAWLEGVDIYLANCAMVYTWSFVKAERSKSLENSVNLLRQLAQQDG